MHNSIKDKILESTDIVEVVGERIALRRRGNEYVGLCPFHPDHKPSLNVSSKKQIFKCWSCGAGGDVIKFVQLRDRVDFREALASLAERAGIELSETEADTRRAGDREELRKVLGWACRLFQRNLSEAPGGQAALEYARRRGLSAQSIERLTLGFAPDAWDRLRVAADRSGVRTELLEQAGLISTGEQGKTYDRFRDRLMFPIRDALGRPIAFGGRTLSDAPAKYLNSPETALFSKSRVLYGLDLAREAIEQARETIVVEGYLDAALVQQYGCENTVATLGTALTDAHAKLLRRFCDSLVLCFDGDQAGMRAADRALEVALRNRIRVRVAVLPVGKDPADFVIEFGQAGFQKMVESAADALEFKWKLMRDAFGAGDTRSKRAAAEELLRFVATVSASGGIDPLEQGLLVGRLSEVLALPAETVHGLLARAKRGSARSVAASPRTEDERSAYDAAIRGVPAGLVSTVEELFGVFLSDWRYFRPSGDTFSVAAGWCDTWKRLAAVCTGLSEREGGFTKAEVLERCEDGALCELVGRACERVTAGSVTDGLYRSAMGRLVTELEVVQMGDLRGHLRATNATDASRAQAFASLLDIARRQHAVLPAESRGNAAITPRG